MVIAGISIAAMYSVFASVQRTSTSNEVTAKVMESLHTCIGFMESDIRMAGLDPSGTANARIEVAKTKELSFTSDRNMNGLIDTANLTPLEAQDFEQVTYAYDAAN